MKGKDRSASLHKTVCTTCGYQIQEKRAPPTVAAAAAAAVVNTLAQLYFEKPCIIQAPQNTEYEVLPLAFIRNQRSTAS
jgi:hypothetical protein